VPLFILTHGEILADHIETLFFDNLFEGLIDLNMENMENVIKLIAHFYYDWIVSLDPADASSDKGYDEDTIYFRPINEMRIKVTKEAKQKGMTKDVSTFLCNGYCKQSVKKSSQIRLNCNHLVCEDCFDKDLSSYNDVDAENYITYVSCTECGTTVDHIVVMTDENKEIYTPLEYGIEPWTPSEYLDN